MQLHFIEEEIFVETSFRVTLDKCQYLQCSGSRTKAMGYIDLSVKSDINFKIRLNSKFIHRDVEFFNVPFGIFLIKSRFNFFYIDLTRNALLNNFQVLVNEISANFFQ